MSGPEAPSKLIGYPRIEAIREEPKVVRSVPEDTTLVVLLMSLDRVGKEVWRPLFWMIPGVFYPLQRPPFLNKVEQVDSSFQIGNVVSLAGNLPLDAARSETLYTNRERFSYAYDSPSAKIA